MRHPSGRDPRDIITPDAFEVAPELLGLPLAHPFRRLSAIAVDGVLIAVLAGAPGVLLGAAAAVILFRASRSSTPAGLLRRTGRFGVRAVASLITLVVVVQLWGEGKRWADGASSPEATRAASAVGGAEGARAAALGFRDTREARALRRADDESSALARASELHERLVDAGLTTAEAADAVLAVALESPREWVRPAAEKALGLEADGPPVDTVRALESRVRHLEAHARALRRAQEAAEAAPRPAFSLLAWIRGLLDDVGIGFGWGALYFTAFTAMWKGRTPGKRLLGIRVIRLDGSPLGWWASFERFGGYATSLITGLLGFAQVLWDSNRQGMHDKISETVVIRGMVPDPAPGREGRSSPSG
jgi:hypothetical protein